MTDQPQAKSRWEALYDRWKAGSESGEPLFERFKGAFNEFSRWSDRRVNPWLLLALSLGLIAAISALTYGIIWAYSHPRLHVVYVLLKSAKWILIGVAFVGALVLRNWIMGRPAEAKSSEPAAK
jgi:hypothetical protein